MSTAYCLVLVAIFILRLARCTYIHNGICLVSFPVSENIKFSPVKKHLKRPPRSQRKKKRLDKYIENKLKKDENLEYLRLLEQEKEKTDALRIKAAGVSGVQPGKRKFGQYVNGEASKKPTQVHGGPSSDADSDADSEDSFEAEHKEAFEGTETAQYQTTTQQGSGLARPLQVGVDGLPVIQTKKRRKKKKRKLELKLHGKHEDDESEWEGFSDPASPINEPDAGANLEEDRDGLSIGDDDYDLEDSGTDDGDDDSEDLSDLGSDESDKSVSDSDAVTSENSHDEDTPPRSSIFKTWATQQLNKSLGHTPSYENGSLELPPHPQQNIEKPAVQQLAQMPQLPEAESSQSARTAYAVHVERVREMEQARSELPIIQREQEIMEAVHNNSVVIIKGDTGSGKTTQVPQFLYEAGYGSKDGPTPGMIGITQPRRVAAVSMAKRVEQELGNHGDRVAYQIRFDNTVSSKTAVKFMTDGILLRELSEDLLLRKYSVIVIDEAHERSVNTDILIGLLSKIVPARMRKNQFNPNPTPLKLVIMSATLNTEDLVNDRLFPAGKKPPIVEAEGRQHRVTTHFALRSRPDYVEEVVEKVRRGHRKLPKGGMLVFLTGQNEILQVKDRLQSAIRYTDSENHAKVHTAASELPFEVEDMEIEAWEDKDQEDFDEVDILTHSDEEEDEDEFDVRDVEDEQQKPLTNGFLSKDPYNSVHILPLYSQLPTKQQLRVFEPAPDGSRLIVLATNVAETSLTIPGIRYVFDAGRSKKRKYNLDSGVQSFEIDYISKASAAQRAGRAGRTGSGHCWRLYSSAVYEQYFPEHAQPEILRAPAESIVLQLKSFAYPKPIVEFPFPSAPHAETLRKAETLLKNLGALTATGSITDLGKELSLYPLSPRLGKIISRGSKETALLPFVVLLVAGLAVSEVFLNEAQLGLTSQIDDNDRDRRKQAYGRARATLSRQDKTSDARKLLTAVSIYCSADDREQVCKDYFLRPKAMFEVSQLHRQLVSIIKANNPLLIQAFAKPSKLASKQIKEINAIASSGYIDQVAIRADLSPNPPDMPMKPRRAIDVPYLPLMPLVDRPSAPMHERAIFIHPSSALARQPHKDLPPYIIYTHLQKSQASSISNEASTKIRMFPLAPINQHQILELAKDTALLEVGKPISSKIEEIRGTPKRRECWVSTQLKAGVGFGWPMPPVRVRQVMDLKTSSGWRVEQWF